MDDRAALALQVAWGADEALGVEPRDRRRNDGPAAPPRIAAAPAHTPAHTSAHTPVATPARAEAARPSGSVAEIDAAWQASGGAGLAVTARHFVGVRGAGDAPVLILGDCPGEAEERSGVAFDGPAGSLLLAMLASAGIVPADLAFGYVVPWRPPGGRPPSDLEVAASVPYFRARLAARPPKIVVPCATVAARTLLGEAAGARSRGKLLQTVLDGGLTLPCLSIQMPEQAMASAAAKARMWASLRLLRRSLMGIAESH